MHSIERFGYKIGMQLNESVLVVEQNNYATKTVNACIAYDLGDWLRNPLNNFTLKNRRFGATNIVKNNDKGNYLYSGYRIAFDGAGSWSFECDFARNVVIFGVDHSSSSHTDNRKKDFLC